MGYQPAKYKCAVDGVIKSFSMTGMCSKIGCGTNLCHSNKECKWQEEIPKSEPPKSKD